MTNNNKQVPLKSVISSGVTALQYVDDYKKQQARRLRKNSTPAEKVMWRCLRNRKLDGLKFRRQQIIEGFIADFYCEKVKLAIEIDGSVHSTTEQHHLDIHREKVFAARGIFTLRFDNDDVVAQTSTCLAEIIDISRIRKRRIFPLSERKIAKLS